MSRDTVFDATPDLSDCWSQRSLMLRDRTATRASAIDRARRLTETGVEQLLMHDQIASKYARALLSALRICALKSGDAEPYARNTSRQTAKPVQLYRCVRGGKAIARVGTSNLRATL